MTRSGFVSISGQPNVGKSTLLNALMNEKVAIVSDKPETTRDNIQGILTLEDCQIIFVDNPGIHKPHDLLGRIMLTKAESSLLEADIVLLLTEQRFAFNKEDKRIISLLPREKGDKKVFLVINKVDRVKDKKVLLPLMAEAQKHYPFDEIIPISALNQRDVARLLDVVRSNLPEGPFFYPEDQLTDKSERFMIQEIIREKVLIETYEEIPHAVAVSVDDLREDEKSGLLHIYATIMVERTSQKSIIIGKNGKMIKQIGQLARMEIERLLERHIYLELWVKVYEKWKKDPEALRELGYSE